MTASSTESLRELSTPLDFLPVPEGSPRATQTARRAGAFKKSAEQTTRSKRQAPRQHTEQQEFFASLNRHIDRYAGNKELPPAIANFIDRQWRSYVSRFCALADRESDNWRQALKTMNDLAWSVRPKTNQVSRRRLIEMIPELYQQLDGGLEFIGSKQTDRDAFFATLVALHNAALNAQGSPARGSHAVPRVSISWQE